VIDHGNGRNHVTWDIETTGFGADDVLSVAGFWFLDGHAVLFLNVYADTHADKTELEQQQSTVRRPRSTFLPSKQTSRQQAGVPRE
jgi:hypothetical protein